MRLPSRLGVAATGRGVTPAAFELRPQLKIIEGRRFAPGRYEVIAGRAVAEQFGVQVGSDVRMRNATLTVVGLFEDRGRVAEMEIWGDKAVFETLSSPAGAQGSGSAFEQTSVLWVKLTPGGLSALNGAIASSTTELMKSLRVRAVSERQFLRAQSNGLIAQATKAAIAVGLVMGAGALFGAINTMYAAVAHRSREIATLRALGFQSLPIAISVISETLLLGLAGALIGVSLALIATHNLAFTLYKTPPMPTWRFDSSPPRARSCLRSAICCCWESRAAFHPAYGHCDARYPSACSRGDGYQGVG